MESYTQTIFDECDKFVTMCIFGNKSDLSNFDVTLEEAQHKCNQLKLKHPGLDIHFLGHASCKTGKSIKQFINQGIELCLNKAIKCDKCGLLILKKTKSINHYISFQGYLQF